MASAEDGSVVNGMGYGEGCPLSSRLGGLGERRELPQQGPGRSPGRKTDFGIFWRPQNAHFCTYMTKSAGDNLHYHPPYSKFWGGRVPPVPPVIYAHGELQLRQLWTSFRNSTVESLLHLQKVALIFATYLQNVTTSACKLANSVRVHLEFCKSLGSKFKHSDKHVHKCIEQLTNKIHLSNSGVSLNWCIINKVTTHNTTAYFFGPLCSL